HRRRRDPAAFVPGRAWAPQSTQSDFLPFVFTQAQVRDILSRVEDVDRPSLRAVVLRSLLLVLYCTGLRLGETVRLRIRDVDMRRRVMFIADSKGRARWVAFDRSLARELARYKAVARAAADPDDPFFIGHQSRRLRVRTISETITALLRATGLKPPSGRV